MYKKKKSKAWILLILLVLVMAAGVGIYQNQRMKVKQEAKEEEIVVQENQELIQFRITKILGNEMTGNMVLEDNREGEMKTWLIPVGTQVVTKLGTVTSFSRLNSGDTIQMLIERDTEQDSGIIKIWITQ